MIRSMFFASLLVGCKPGAADATSEASSDHASTAGGIETGLASTGSSGTTAQTSTSDQPTTSSTQICGTACGATKTLEGNHEVWPDDDPNAFDCVSQINGDLTFVSSGWAKDQFASLQRITGTMRLSGACASFWFLPCLDTVGSLVIEDPEDCFTEFKDAQSLHTIELELKIHNAPGLKSLDGLQHLVNGPPRVDLFNNPKLTSTAGPTLPAQMEAVHLARLPQLQNLDFLGSMEAVGSLSLSDLPAIANLSGLANLEIAGSLEIGGCPGLGQGLDGLFDLSGLDAMKSIGDLSIVDNKSLVSLSGAPNLTNLDRVIISENDMLSDLEIGEFLAQNQNPDTQVCTGDISECKCP